MLTADYWDRNTDSPHSQPTVLPYAESFLAGYEEDRTETQSYHGTFGISNSRWNDFSIPPTINLPESNIKMSRLVEIGMRLISRLEKFSVMQSLVEDYLNNSQVAPIAAPLVLGALSDLRKFLECDGEANGDKYALCLKITENTCRPFEIPPNVSAQQFHTLFTGDNLRWEFIGLAFTWMALSMLRSQGDVFSQNRELSNTSSLPETMAECSNSCISLCQNIVPPNDVMIWLLYDNLVLSTQLHGDFSCYAWQRLGDLSAAVFAVGLHRDEKAPMERSTEVPFFLLQSRKRAFAASYQIDKRLANVFIRPPRIPGVYSDYILPLDLDDNTLFYNGPALERALSNLDAKGWNKDQSIRPVTWIRLRYILSKFREEALGVWLSIPKVDIVQELRDILQRSNDAWAFIPPHLHYDESCWQLNLPIPVCVMLLAVFLEHLRTQFLLQRLLCRHWPAAKDALIKVSMQLLSTVMVMTSPRIQCADIRREAAWMLPLYALPSIGVLAIELRQNAYQEHLYPDLIPRVQLIKHLGVLISHLELVADPGDTNYDRCIGCSQVMEQILEEVVESASVLPNCGFNGDVAQFNSEVTLLGPILTDTEVFLTWLDNSASFSI
jgi:hypothetical protein